MHNTAEDTGQIALLKQIRRDYTSSKDWPRLSGEGEYNHNGLTEWVDPTSQEQGFCYKLVTAKCILVLTGIAREWYVEKRKDTESMTFPEWKEAIQIIFGTNQCKKQVEENFLADNFNPIVHKTLFGMGIKATK